MSKTVDERVVSMQFDNKHFESNVQTTLGTLDKLKKSLNLEGAAKGLNEINLTASKTDMSALNNGIETARLKFSALQVAGITALSNITNTAVDAGKKIISALTIDPIKTGFQEYETQINAVQTILANTESKGTTLQQVNRALDELNTYADKTIYNFSEMTKNIGTFTAAGIDLDTSVSAIQGIANLAAVSGSTSQQASTAMYQLSQALASGTVKLMDWNSVVNAGMGGQVFQDALKRTARVHGVAIDDMIKSEGSFRETLKDGWLTSEILTETLSQFTMAAEKGSEEWKAYKKSLMDTGYTEKQAISILNMANTATNAATKVKTFTQLWDTLKESAQSGWARTWEIMVGDFEEAKSFLTDISDRIGGMIGASADARNKLLSGGLSSGWKQLLDEGIADEEGYKDTLKSVAKEQGISIDKMIKSEKKLDSSLTDNEAFQNALKKGLKEGTLTSDMFTESVYKLSEKMSSMSAEELKAAGYTADHVKQIKDLSAGLKDGSVSMDEFVKKMMRPSGRENIIQALWNSFDKLMNILTIIKEAFREVFPAMTGEQLYGLTVKLRELTENFKIGDKTLSDIKSTFKGLFAILDIVAKAFFAVCKVLSPLLILLKDLGVIILSATGYLGGLIVGFDEAADKTGIFGDIAQKASDKLRQGVNIFRQWVKSVAEIAKVKIKIPGIEALHAILGRMHERLSIVTNSFEKMSKKVKDASDTFHKGFDKSGLLKIFQAITEGIRKMAEGFGEVMSNIIEQIGNTNFDGALDFVNTIFLGGISTAIARFIHSISKPIEDLGSIKNSIIGILDSVRDTFKAYQSQLKAGILMKLATAIAILAGSILVLSFIDSDKLTKSLVAIGAMFSMLVGSMALLEKLDGFDKKTRRMTNAMITMSISVLILASAMKKISDLDWNGIAKSLVGIGGLCAILVASAKILSTGSKKLLKGAMSLIPFAYAIKILADVCKDLSSLSWESMMKGLVGVGILMAEVSLFLNTAKMSLKATSTAIGVLILAAAMKVLASACDDFGSMDWEIIKKSLISIGILLGELALFTNLAGSAKHVVATGLALVLVASSMKIFASAMSDFGSMNWEQIGKGLTAMGGALMEVAIAMKLMPKSTVLIATGLVVVAASLEIMADVLNKFGNFSWEQIGKGLTVLGVALIEFAIGLNLMKGTLGGSASLLIAASALAVLTPTLSVLGAMSWTSIAKGLITLAGAFAILGVAGFFLAPLTPVILGLSVAFGILSVGVGILSAALIAMNIAGLIGNIASLIPAFALGVTNFVSALKILVAGLLDLIPLAMKKVGEGIITFCEVIAQGATAIGDTVKTIVLTIVDVLVECVPTIADGFLKVLTGVLSALVEYIPKISELLFQLILKIIENLTKYVPQLVTSIVNLFKTLFSSVISALGEINTDSLVKTLGGIGLITAIIFALGFCVSLIPAAMAGVLGMGAVIAELALVLAAIGALAQIPGLDWLINEGGTLLQDIGAAIGGFIGGIVGGIASGITSQLPQIGSDLSLFMECAQPFIDGAKQIDASMMEGVKTLAETILILTAADVLDGLTSWITGGSSLSQFGSELVPFGESLRVYSNSVSGIDSESIKNSATAAKALASFASSIPNTGGLVAAVTGDNDLATFGIKMVAFGTCLKLYSQSVAGLDMESITASAKAGKALTAFASTIPNTGGLVAAVTGDNDLATFGVKLKMFGISLKSYSDNVTGIDTEAIKSSAGAAKALTSFAGSIPKTGGLKSVISGDNDIVKFGKKAAGFAEQLAKYCDNISGVDSSSINSSIYAAKNLFSFIKSTNGLDASGIGKFQDAIKKLASTDMSGFTSTFSKASAQMTNAASGMMNAIVKGINSKAPAVTNAMARMLSNVNSSIKNKLSGFTNLGRMLMARFYTGFDSQKNRVSNSAKSAVLSAANAIRTKYNSFYTNGRNLGRGLVEGIDSKQNAAYNAGYRLGQAAVKGEKDGQKSNSPSKLTILAGKWLGEGLVIGMNRTRQSVYRAGSSLGETASNTISSAVSRVADLVDLSINSTPTIKPVLDLSDVRSGVGTINGLFADGQSIGVTSNISAISSMMSRRNQNGTTNDVISAIDKLRKDLGNVGNTSYTINGITYDDGSNVSQAIQTLVRAAKVERRR